MPSLNLTLSEASDVASYLLPHVPEKAGIEFDYYEITSEAGSLDPAAWNSLDAQNVDAVDGDDPGASIVGLLMGVGWALATRRLGSPFGFAPAIVAGALVVLLLPRSLFGLLPV